VARPAVYNQLTIGIQPNECGIVTCVDYKVDRTGMQFHLKIRKECTSMVGLVNTKDRAHQPPVTAGV
jgi:hypothetical protein